jgi:hypothetical protein
MRWRGRGGLAVGLALSVAVWIALGVVTAGSPDRHDFVRAATKSAQRALSAVRTAHLVGQAYLNGRVTRAFLSPLLDNSVQGVVTAQQELARTPPPDASEAGTRGELMTLLDQAGRATGDLARAFHRGDDTAARAAVDALAPIGDRLADLLEHQQW